MIQGTKKYQNNYITIYKVDDGTHQINISFFEDKYTKYKNILVEDEILFFNGEIYIDDYDSQLTMRADSVFPIRLQDKNMQNR